MKERWKEWGMKDDERNKNEREKSNMKKENYVEWLSSPINLITSKLLPDLFISVITCTHTHTQYFDDACLQFLGSYLFL